MLKTQRTDFLRQNNPFRITADQINGNLEASTLLEEAGVSKQDIRRADRNQDGFLDAREAWTLADNLDNDGTRRSLISQGAEGQETGAGKTVRALNLMFRQFGQVKENDDVLLVGMNRGSAHEARTLRASSRGRVSYIHDSALGDDKVRAGGRTWDLNTQAGREGFVQTLGLPEAQSQKIADVIAGADRDGKDELAQIAQVWARGEKGQRIPSRLVLSGHHVGSAVWGDDNGEISWHDLKGLSDAMPNAARQVKDLHISACYSGGSKSRAKYQEIFPNASTIWAYSASAPGSWTGATDHLKAWERATRRGGTDVHGAAERLESRGVRKAENIDAGKVGSTQGASATSLEDIQETLLEGEEIYREFFTGAQDVTNSQQGPLRNYYSVLQFALQHQDLPESQIPALEARRDQTIRLLFFNSHLRGRFAEAHGDTVGRGFRALGLEAPNLRNLSRAETMRSIDAFRGALENSSERPAEAVEALRLLNGLWNLDPAILPQNWI